MEYLIVPVQSGVSSRSRHKLGSSVKVIETAADEDPVEDSVIRAFGRPLNDTKYLVVPLDGAMILRVKPTIETELHSFESYLSL